LKKDGGGFGFGFMLLLCRFVNELPRGGEKGEEEEGPVLSFDFLLHRLKSEHKNMQ